MRSDTFVAGLDAQDADNIRLVLLPANTAVDLPWPHTMRACKKAAAFKRFWSNYLERGGAGQVVVVVQAGAPIELVDWITQRGCEVLWLSERSVQTFLVESTDLEIEKPYRRAHALALSGVFRLNSQSIVHATFVDVQMLRHLLENMAHKLEKLTASLPAY